ncbi:MAG: response regulator [Nitrososphaera sp.]|jgi:DNA-binding response OmpR family regulator
MATTASRILLVEDEKDILSTLKRGLELEGFAVTAFDNPVVALAKYYHAEYDLALLDIRMPGMNGFELARALWEKNSSLQVCFLTAFEIYEAEARRAFPSMKNHCFLTKPIAIEALARHIRTRLAKSQSKER